MSGHTPSRARPGAPLSIRLAFKERYLEDCRRDGAPASVECYAKAFSEHEEAIRGEYERLEQQRAGRESSLEPWARGVQHVGPYRVDAELARGGQAVVYSGYDEQLDRRVALKVLKVGPTFGGESLLRFEREAKVLSRIEDPHVCPIYATGCEQGVAWIAMRFVDGRTVASHIADTRARNVSPSPERTLEILEHGEAVLATLDKVHELGILHRDLKPGNVMIDADGPVILDFGLARDQRELDLTLSTDQLGTPAYMAPEQVRGQPADRRADIRAFGILLLEWLTGWHPFQAATREQMFRRILDESVDVPKSIRRSLPRPLITVLMTAIAAEPDRRYQTAADFAEDLRRVRASEPIRARPMGVWGRSLLWVSRNRVLAAMAVLLFLVLSSALWFSNRVIGELRDERRVTNTALRKVRALALLAEAKVRGEGQPQLGLQLALEAHRTDVSVDTLSAVYRAYDRMRVLAEYRTDPTTLVTARPTRDGRSCICGYTDGAVRFFQEPGKTLTRHAHDAGILGIEVTQDGKRAITVDRSGRLVLWDAESAARIFARDMNVSLSCMATGPSDQELLLGDSTGRVWIGSWALARVEPRLVCTLAGAVERLLISPAGGHWVALTDGGEAVAFDKAGTRIHEWAIAGNGIGDFVDETRVVTQSSDRVRGETRYGLRVVDLVKRQQLDTPGFYAIHRLVSARGSRLGTIAICAGSGTAHLVRLATGSIVPQPRHPGPIYSMSFDENGRLVTACADGKIRLLGPSGELLQEFLGHEAACTHVEFARSGRRLLSQGRDGLLAMWSTIGPADLDLPTGQVGVTRQSRNGEFFVSSLHGEVIATDGSGAVLFRLPTPDDPALDVILASDGDQLLVQHASGRTSCWRCRPAARRIGVLHPGGVDSQSAFLDERGTVLSRRDSRLRYWRPEAGELRSIGPADDPPTALAASERLGVAASGHRSGRIIVWNAEGEPLASFAGHARKVIGIIIDPKRRRVISAGLDRLCNCFDFSGKRVFTSSYDAVVTLLRLSPDAELLLVGTETGEARLLRSASNSVVAMLPKLNGAPITGTIDGAGSLVAIGTTRGAVSLWRTDGTLCARLPGDGYVSAHVAFTLDGRHLLVSGNGRRSSLYPVRAEDLLAAARGRVLRGLRPDERDALGPLLRGGH